MHSVKFPSIKIRSYTIFAMIGWTIIMLGLVAINWDGVQDHILELARTEARTSIQKDLLYRNWNTSHGGVYVPVTEDTQPNPYLNAPEREITTPSGRLLTLMNPAYMNRQIFETQDTTGIHTRLTSLNPINPANAADSWEEAALLEFENGATEISSVESSGNNEYMRLMSPFIATEACLRCHADQGYEVGDVRGGLSVSIPLSKYAELKQTPMNMIGWGYGTVWLLGITGIYLTSNDLKKYHREREAMLSSLQQSHKKLEASEDKFSKIFRFSPALVMLSALEDGKIIDVNKKFLDGFGFTRAEVIGKTPVEVGVIHARDRKKLKQELLSAGHLMDAEIPFHKKDGSEIICLYNGELIELEGKTFVLSLAQDITGQKRAEEQLRESEASLKFSQQVAHVGHWTWDTQTNKVTWSDEMYRVFGLKPEKFDGNLNQIIEDAIHPDDRAKVNASNQAVLTEQRSASLEYRVIWQDHSVHTIWAVPGGRVTDENGRILKLTGIVQDITERKQAEESLRENESLLMQAQQVANLGYYQLDIHSGVWKSSKILDEIFGIEADYCRDVQGWAGVVHPDEREEMVTYFSNDVLGRRKNFDREYRIQRIHDQAIRWVHGMGELQFDTYGVPFRMLGTIQDITKRKQDEDAQIKVQQNYENLIQTVDGIVWEADAQTFEFSFVSNQAERLLGYPVSSWLADPKFWANHIHPDDREEAVNFCVAQTRGKRAHEFEYRMISQDGSIVWLRDVVSVLVENDQPSRLRGIMIDITEKKLAEEKLHQLSLAVEQNPASVLITDLNGCIEYINPKFTQVTGYTREEVIGNNPRILKSGATSQVEYKNLWQAITSGKVWHGELHNRKKNGELFWEDAMISPLTDDAGRITHFVAVKEDITERKRSEKEILEKNADLAALFSISAHLRTAASANDMLPLVLQEMGNVFSADANAVILLEPRGGTFVYALGDGTLAINTGLRFSVDNSISGIVMQTREPYITSDFANDPNRTAAVKNFEHLGPVVLVPLQSETEFIGNLLCARRKDSPKGDFSNSEIQLLTSIGEMVGTALRRARLYDDALLRLQRVQGLRAIDMAMTTNMDLNITLTILLNQALILMGVDAADILSFNPLTRTLNYVSGQGFHTQAMERAQLRLGEGMAGRAAVERRAIAIQDISSEGDILRKEILKKEGLQSLFIAPMVTKGQMRGVLELYSRKPYTPNDEWMDFLEALATQAAIAIDSSQLYNDLQRSNLELSMAYDATIEGWSHALDLKDKETEGHTLRVTDWTIKLAALAGMSEMEIVHLRRGALLHDIGKMGIPDRILGKTGKLTSKEWDIMRKHTIYGYNMIYPIEFLRPAIDIPYCHHEKWDGTGYPRGLKAEQIPYAARLFAIVDVWDAITSDRPYRRAWSFDQALDYIKSEKGRQFDPEIVDLFLKILDEL